ncbi:MAG: XRE family transcriptional regulator [Proteobacteria bacterium]|nr:XRE family transcriptional regulator [Pseudomonadota bacterium]
MAQKPLADRLKAAREKVGLSIVKAAKRLGFSSYQTLSKIEAGEREVKAAELNLFARAYFCTISYLLDESPAKQDLVLLWRKTPDVAVKKEIEAQVIHFCEQYQSLEHLLGLKSNKDPKFFDITIDNISTNSDIDSLANSTRKLLELGSRPAFSLRNILEQTYGIKFTYQPLFNISSAASTVHPEFGPVIVMNSDEAPWRRNYDLAHELFHLITWKVIPVEELRDDYLETIEKKAERFASVLLLPESEVRETLQKILDNQKSLSYADLVDIAREFGVSTKALLYRLSSIGLFDWETADSLAKNEELLGLDKVKRKNEWGDKPVSERFHALAVKCLRKGLISRGKFAEIVGIDRSEIDMFIEDFGLMETEGASIEIMASRC